MNLYKEEQVRDLLRQVWTYTPTQIDNLIDIMQPIELPSDEDIYAIGKYVIIYNDTKRGWFIEGLKFMRDKIQGGNK